jgi:hypothetical protein
MILAFQLDLDTPHAGIRKSAHGVVIVDVDPNPPIGCGRG